MLIPLILGILMYEWLQLRHYLVLSVFLSLSIVYIILVIRRLGVKKKIWYGTLLQMMLLTFGYNLASYQDDIQDVTHFSKQANADFNTILGSVIDVKERLYRYELVVDVERVENDLDNSRTNGLLNAYVNYDDLDIEVKVGQKVFFQSEINNHPLPKNPFVFDYGKFLSRKRIYHSTSNLRNFEVLSHPTDIRFWFHNQREKLLQNLHQKMQSDDNYAIAASILLGYRNDVGRDLKRSFAETGSMHVLAVSGLHVGIIWWIVGMVLGLFRSSSGSAKFLRVATQLLVIWGFAFLTG
ncbi:MAG: DUF4131 domain-containing protein, partial [Saprospiraceae bacterium]|nr:DUF4131 domain-containing protein [Saprospiraceae bacterium]